MNNARGKSGLFLLELLIVIIVFAVCAAICARIFTDAYLTAKDSRDVGRAVNLARSAAEGFKATGDIYGTLELLCEGGYYYIEDDTAEIYYDENLHTGLQKHETVYMLRIEPVRDGPLPAAVITVRRASGDELFTLKAVSRVGGNDG
jgi:hypothetical protein